MARLRNVNTTDLAAAIRLGCRTMCSVFDADDQHRPFFASLARPEARLSFSAWHSESHVPGRHLNALLSAEQALWELVGDEAIERHRRAAFFSYGRVPEPIGRDGESPRSRNPRGGGGGVPLPLPLNRARKDGPVCRFIPHNVREGFHALYALSHYCEDEQARELAEESVAFILRHWDPRRGWDAQAFRERGVELWTGELDTFITGIGRAIGPLAKLYRSTGHRRTLELALLLADKATGEFFLDGGEYDPQRFGNHTHSTTCVMSGLAQLADLLGDAALLHRVKAFYDRGLWRIRDELGWVIESADRQGPDADAGEVNNTGDIVETALILGRHGFPEYYEDAERILRCHLLPSQLRDNSFIQDPPNPTGEDGLSNVAERHLGAFGFPAPYGHQPAGVERVSFNMDIVGGAVGSLCEAYREVVGSSQDYPQHRVNLLFDHQSDAIRVESPYATGRLAVMLKQPGALWVRLPSWVMRQKMQVIGAAGPYRLIGGWFFTAEQPDHQPIELRFDLPVRELVLRHRAHDIRVRLRGDEVMAMDNFGADLTFFEPYA